MADFLTEAFLRIRERMGGVAKSGTAWAEDALQDAFVKLWGRYSPKTEKEAEALLARTARNSAVDEKRRRKPIPLERDVEQEESNADEREEMFLKIENLARDHLSDIQQYIIRRHQYEGARLETIAKELEMNAPAVRMQLSRARKTLRELYEKQELL